uniref:Uncharacterized protein n=1 Tax=Cyanistes caeruleus TaxID=156563 RepID=A0A8C0UC07_CYACU
DILGNLLVILSVFRNRKLRNSGKGLTPAPCPGGGREQRAPGVPPLSWCSLPAVLGTPARLSSPCRLPAEGGDQSPHPLVLAL